MHLKPNNFKCSRKCATNHLNKLSSCIFLLIDMRFVTNVFLNANWYNTGKTSAHELITEKTTRNYVLKLLHLFFWNHVNLPGLECIESVKCATWSYFQMKFVVSLFFTIITWVRGCCGDIDFYGRVARMLAASENHE